MRYDHKDARVCDCCELPTCVGKTFGRGYICALCLIHWDQAFDVTGQQEQDQRRTEDHELLAGIVAAVEAYHRDHDEIPVPLEEYMPAQRIPTADQAYALVMGAHRG